MQFKGQLFTVPQLLGVDKLLDRSLRTEAQRLTDACMHRPERTRLVSCRLAPGDYHRFHSPCDGVLGTRWRVGQDLYSVKPIAVRSDVDVLTDNRRDVLVLHGDTCGDVVFVAIGATLVGSIVWAVEPGQRVKRGDLLGWFAYGGSQVVLLLPGPERAAHADQAPEIRLSDDLRTETARNREVLVHVRSAIGAVHGAPKL